MQKFEKDKVYKFGVLSQTGVENPTAPFPDFSPRPRPVSVAGQVLLKAGIKTFDDYLVENIHGYDPKKIVHCYTFDKIGNRYQRFSEGNPMPQKKDDPQDIGLSDGQYMPGQYNPNFQRPAKIDISNLEEIYGNQIASYQLLLDQKENKITELIDKNIQLQEEIGSKNSEIRSLEIELEKMEGLIDKMTEMGGSSGLGDSNKLLEIIGPYLANEELVSGISNWIKSKLSGVPANNVQQQQQPVQNNQRVVDSYIPITTNPGDNGNANS